MRPDWTRASPPAAAALLYRLWEHERISYALRVFIALLVAWLVCWQLGNITAMATVFLGLIASAVADTDDHWIGRSKAVAVQMTCFVVAAVGVVVLFPYPPLFLLGLVVSTFAVIQLGALGPRYVLIAQATLTLATYTMVTVQWATISGSDVWWSILPLLAGAGWYGVLSILWSRLLARRPVRARLAHLFHALDGLMQAKAELITPAPGADVHALRLQLAKRNGAVVDALNSTGAAIASHFGRSGRPEVESGILVRLYSLAQELQERANPVYHSTAELPAAHQDLLHRLAHLTRLQGHACGALASAVHTRTAFEFSIQTRQARDDLDAAIAGLTASASGRHRHVLGALQLAVQDLGRIERQIADALAQDPIADDLDTHLRDAEPQTLAQMWARIRRQFTPQSTIFRHGVRMAVALAVGYALQPLLAMIDIDNGYWLMMTTVFVSRNSYATTRLRMFQRIFGTFFGVPVAWALLQMTPSVDVQMLIASVMALVFLTTRAHNYMLASAAVSVMALLCFNQMGDGYVALAPRLLDTVLGAMIAFLAAALVLPAWQGKRLHGVAAAMLRKCAHYLDVVLAHYGDTPGDARAYEAARRDMHNADAALSASVTGLLREPAKHRGDVQAGFRFLALANTLLSHLSALGAHRGPLDRNQDAALIAAAGQTLEAALGDIARSLEQRQPGGSGDVPAETDLIACLDAAATRAEDAQSEADPSAGTGQLVLTQLVLMLRLLPALRSTADALLQGRPAPQADAMRREAAGRARS